MRRGTPQDSPVSIALREDRDSDFEALYRLDQECYAPHIAYSRRVLREFLHVPGALCRVAEDSPGGPDEAIAGFIIAREEWRSGQIITLDVRASHRRLGIGSMLLEEVERLLAAAGAREIELETAVNDAAAGPFWRKHGYAECGLLKNYYGDDADAH